MKKSKTKQEKQTKKQTSKEEEDEAEVYANFIEFYIEKQETRGGGWERRRKHSVKRSNGIKTITTTIHCKFTIHTH